MADYQIRARVPQETADKLFNVMKDLQENMDGADVTMSSVVRQALDDYMKAKENESVTVDVEKLNKVDLKSISDLLRESTQGNNNLPWEAKKFLLTLEFKILAIEYRRLLKDERELEEEIDNSDK